MFELAGTIRKSISKTRMAGNLARFASYHRIQASQGHREAAEYLSGFLTENGIENRILRYPAQYGIDHLGHRGFEEWNCNLAFLNLVFPQQLPLADFTQHPTSLIQRSGPIDFSDRPTDIVYLDRGSGEENYPDLDLSGKIAFVRERFQEFEWIFNRGAIGIISDMGSSGLGEEVWTLTARHHRYQSFWYYDRPEKTPFGFSITALAGDRLAKTCLDMRAGHAKNPQAPEYPQAVGAVDAAFCPGEIEVVEATLPGESEDEVWLVSHSCHPKPSANDNASGVAASCEALIALSGLIANGTLPKNHYGIKAIFMPEFSGTFPYLAYDANPAKVKCALNLDMVGARQGTGYGPITLTSPHMAAPSLTGQLAYCALREASRVAGIGFVNIARETFSGGSDHIILSDPAIGIPTPMLGQWPDATYHSSGDSLEVIDHEVLASTAATAAAYACLAGSLSEAELGELFAIQLGDFAAGLNRILSGDSPLPATERLTACHEVAARDAMSARSMFPVGSTPQGELMLSKQLERLAFVFEGAMALASESQRDPDPAFDTLPKGARETVWARTSPALAIGSSQFLSPEMKGAHAAFKAEWGHLLANEDKVFNLAQYQTDGKRTLFETIRRVMHEAEEKSPQAVCACLELMRKDGIFAVTSPGKGE